MVVRWCLLLLIIGSSIYLSKGDDNSSLPQHQAQSAHQHKDIVQDVKVLISLMEHQQEQLDQNEQLIVNMTVLMLQVFDLLLLWG